MSLEIQNLSRRTILGVAGALSIGTLVGTPLAVANTRSPYTIETWTPLVTSNVQINGGNCYVRKVEQGYGQAFHVIVAGGRLTEGLLEVSHPSFGVATLFAVVQGNAAVFTINAMKEAS